MVRIAGGGAIVLHAGAYAAGAQARAANECESTIQGFCGTCECGRGVPMHR